MGVAIEVLNPQDCLRKPFFPEALVSPLPSQAQRPKSHGNPTRSKSNRVQQNRKSRPNRVTKPPLTAATVEKPANFFANGTVRILKRGENLQKATPILPADEISFETSTDLAAGAGSFNALTGADLSDTKPDLNDGACSPHDPAGTTPDSPYVSCSSGSLTDADLSVTTPDSPYLSCSSGTPTSADTSKSAPDSPCSPCSPGIVTVASSKRSEATHQVRVRSGNPYLADGFYAGPATCVVSPPPSSLPLPAFFRRKVAASNSEATSALMKMLRLDLG